MAKNRSELRATSQKHAELKKLSKEVQGAIYDMLRLASEILADPEYVDQYGGGPALLDHLEKTEFSHFGGKPSLASMLRAYDANPSRSTWAEYRFNVQAMIELAKPTKDAAGGKHINWKARAKELEEKLESRDAMLEDYRKMLEAANAKIEALSQEAGELRGRLKAMEEYSRKVA